jgi:hypothetical protein
MEEKELLHKKWVDKIYMLHENQLWLGEQAAKGLILTKFDDEFAYFTETEPDNVCYKIMILDEKKGQSIIKTIESQGFTYIGNYNEYHIFRIDGKYKHIEPLLNEAAIEFARKWFRKTVLGRFAGTAAFLGAFLVQIVLNRDHLIQIMVETPAVWYVFFILVFIYLCIRGLAEYRTILNAKKYFLNGEDYLPNRFLKKSPGMRVFFIIICAMGAFLLIQNIYFKNEQYDSIADVEKAMPILLLQELKEQGLQQQKASQSQNTGDADNYAETERSLLASQYYRAKQKTEDNYMSIHYYELVFDKLAEPLAKELPNGSVASILKEKPKKVDFKGLDTAYAWQKNDFVIVSACRGNQVMYVFSVGDIGAEEILKGMAEVL